MLRNSPILGQHFAFAHGRSGVLQQHLLTQSDIDRLLGAHDRNEVRGILMDLPFTKLLDQSQRDADHVIDACGAWIRAEVASMVPVRQRAPFDILWLQGDAPLLAALLKERLGLTSAMSKRPHPAVTVYPVDHWTRLVLEGDATVLPPDLTLFVQETLAAPINDPAQIDMRVAALMNRRMLLLARRSGSRLLQRFVRHDIDIRNIRTALRLEEQDNGADTLLPGGTIDAHIFMQSDRNVSTIVRRHGFYALADVLEEPGHTGSDIERALLDIRSTDIANLWNKPLGMEPVFAFAATALQQLTLLRAILIGKQSALAPQDIKRLLPPFLSASHYQS